MTLELYPGYLSLGGNEIINNERTRGILEALDCPVPWFKDDDSRCRTVQNAIDPPYLTDWTDVATNLVANPSMETADVGVVEVRRNYVKNPRGIGVSGSGSTSASWVATGAARTAIPGGAQVTTSATTGGTFGPYAALPVSTLCAVRFDVVASVDTTADLVYRPAGYLSTTGEVVIGTVVMLAGVPRTIEAAFTTPADVPGSGAGVFLRSANWGGTRDIAMTYPIVEAAPVCAAYFDGATSPDPDFTAAWTGTVDQSESVLRGAAVVDTVGGAQSSAWSASRDSSLYVTGAVGAGTDSYAVLAAPAGGWVPDQSYTALATVHLDGPQDGTLNARARMIAAVFSNGTTVLSDAAPNSAGETLLRVSFTAPAAPATMELRLYNGASRNMGVTWWDDALVAEIPSLAAPYLGGYFDGDTPNEPLQQYVWNGTADDSTSTTQTRELIFAPSFEGASVADAPWYDLDIPDTSGDFFGTYALTVESTSNSTRQAAISEGILNGGSIGRMRLGTRSVRVQALLFARNSAGLEYGRSWLESATQPGACGQHGTRCGVTDLLYLADCPPELSDFPADGAGYNDTVDRLVRFMHAVEVTSGPFTVEEYQFNSNNFVAQLVEFTVSSERAYTYGRTRAVDLPTSDSVVVQDTPFNLVPYPSAELVGSDVVVARNLSTNPSVEVNTTGWTMSAIFQSGTSPASYFTSGRSTDIAAAGAASMRGRILGNGTTEVAASTAIISAEQSVALGSLPAGTRFSCTIWGAGIIFAGAAVSSISQVNCTLLWLDGGGVQIGAVSLGSTADPVQIQGRTYSANSLLPPAGAVTAKVRVQFTVGWRSSATPANNSDVRAYVDALAVTVP